MAASYPGKTQSLGGIAVARAGQRGSRERLHEWILEQGRPWVRYRALLDLLGRSEKEELRWKR